MCEIQPSTKSRIVISDVRAAALAAAAWVMSGRQRWRLQPGLCVHLVVYMFARVLVLFTCCYHLRIC